MSERMLAHQRLINFTMLVATAIVVARTALLAVSEPYPWMSEAGELMYDASLAFATAWLFQWLVISRPAQSERNALNSILAPKVDRLIYVGLSLADVVASAAGRPHGSFRVDAQEIAKICHKASPSDDAPGWASSWSAVLQHFGNQAQRARTSLSPLYARLEPDLLEALAAEEDAMESMLQLLRLSDAHDADNLSRLADPMTRWLTSIDMLCAVRRDSVAPTRDLPKTTPLEKGRVNLPMDEVVRQLAEIKTWIKEFDGDDRAAKPS